MSHFDRQGAAISLESWVRLFGDDSYKIVSQHWIRGYMVSTVWLGLDHNFFGGGAPLIFETMIFPPGDEAGEDGVWSEHHCERYPTEAAALAGHDRAIAIVRERTGADDRDVLTADQFRNAES